MFVMRINYFNNGPTRLTETLGQMSGIAGQDDFVRGAVQQESRGGTGSDKINRLGCRNAIRATENLY